MKKILTVILSLVTLPLSAQIATDQIALKTFTTSSAAMTESASQIYPLGMIPFGTTYNYGSPYIYHLTSYTTIQQLSNFESAACSVTDGGGDDPVLWDFTVGCHTGQNGWSVTSRATYAEVLTFYAALTSREKKTFAWWKAPGVQSSEQYRFVMNWQPEFTYCISGPI